MARFVIERDLEMETRDGTVLRADVYRDADSSEPRPVLLMRTPYDKGFSQLGIYPHPFWLVQRAFIVVIQDVRGRFRSEGEFEPFRAEASDGYEAVEWAAALPGSNGRVGMYGASYAGATQLLAAVGAPLSLRAIAPAVTSGDFHGDWFYEGGAFSLAFAAYWAAQLSENLYARQAERGRMRDALRVLYDLGRWYPSAPPSGLEPIAHVPFYRDWLSHPTRDAYWEELDASRRFERVRAAGLHIGGWYDIFLSGTLDAFLTLSALGNTPEQLLLVGPWAHWPWGTDAAGALTFSPAAAGLVLDAQVRFFRRHLSDEKLGPDPAVRYFPVFDVEWRKAATWPPPEAHEQAWYLRSGGLANRGWGDGRLDLESPPEDEPADFYAFHGRYATPSVGGHSCLADPSLGLMGPYERSELERWFEVLCYTSAPLENQLNLAGPAKVTLWVRSSARSADYHATLAVARRDGSVYGVADGIRRIQLPGEGMEDPPTRVEIDLRAACAVVQPGERLRLDVAGGSFPIFDRNPQTGMPAATAEVTDMTGATHAVLHSAEHPSRLSLFVVSGDHGGERL